MIFNKQSIQDGFLNLFLNIRDQTDSKRSIDGNTVYMFTVTCQDRSLSNGQVMFDRDPVDNGQYGLYPVGTTSTFTCRDGYSALGHTTSTFLMSGSWSQPAPTCIGREILIFRLGWFT